jgi:hypothetical protein
MLTNPGALGCDKVTLSMVVTAELCTVIVASNLFSKMDRAISRARTICGSKMIVLQP